MFDVGVPALESLRPRRVTAPVVYVAPAAYVPPVAYDACDWVLLCEGGVEVPVAGEGDEKTADLGLPAGDPEVALAKGLLRRWPMPLALALVLAL